MMNGNDRTGDAFGSVGDPDVAPPSAPEGSQRAVDADQTSADADQSAADADQSAADADQSDSAADQSSADSDQRASDRDQVTADRDHAADTHATGADQSAYETSREERESASVERFGNRLDRSSTAHDRELTATDRDSNSETRDEGGRARDARTTDLPDASTQSQADLIRQLEELRAQAGADRVRAAADRARAAADRANAARERDRLEAELRSAHLDELTGAYRREMGRMALTHEIDRARRSNGQFVLAFVDVDRLKIVNDREGHAAGDRVLQTVVREIRSRLRSFDPIIRYGGDEFVCGIGGTDLEEAKRRFNLIGDAIEADARVGISVGLAALSIGDTADQLTERADAAMLEIKATHHSRQ
jgi:diguanylate cyclase (GGDEF)-like protein